jgi:hypothetical protein
MTRRFAGYPGVICVQQLGHVNTPGISDIDMLVVFDESARFECDPLEGLSRTDRYLFVHSLFAVSEEDYAEAAGHTFFHNVQVRWGVVPDAQPAPLSAGDQKLLKRQIALEYLVRIFISLTVEITYRVVKLRNLFLHAKAMLYDCEFLGVSSGPFYEGLTKIVQRRNQWFERGQDSSLAGEIAFFHEQFCQFLSGQLQESGFFLPARDEYRVGRHVRLVNSTRLNVRHRGLVLPAALTRLGGRRGFNLQHRFNEFELALPFRTSGLPGVIQRTFALLDRMESKHRLRFPHFICPIVSLVADPQSGGQAKGTAPVRNRSSLPLERSAGAK